MHVLNIYDPQNTFVRTVLPNGSGWFKRDGDEFERQKRHCFSYYYSKHDAIIWGIAVEGKNAFDKRKCLFRFLEDKGDVDIKFDRINFLMHGGKYNLNRKMITMDKRNRKGDIIRRGNIGKFAKLLKSVASPGCKIVLYSCWTGAKEYGFAAELSRLTGLNVIAHTTRGHTTKNPMKVVYNYPRACYELASKEGGIRALEKKLWSSDSAPFEFVEDVFSGGNESAMRKRKAKGVNK